VMVCLWLQVVSTGWPVFSLAWSNKQRLLVAGGNSVLHIYKVSQLALGLVYSLGSSSTGFAVS
jgi:hypothetical protein